MATKCAAALKMDRQVFLELQLEPVRTQSDGTYRTSYRELVRRNFLKEYVELQQSELEKYLDDDEFIVVFGKEKVMLCAMFCS